MLQSKVALITGGSSGIGLETAKVFIENGAFVYITGRNEDRLKNAISILGNNAKYIRADISKKDDMLNVRDVIKNEKGHLDVVFANAGVGKYISFEDITEEDIDWTFNNNFKGTIFTIQSVLPILNDGASIILNTSVTANLGLPRFSLYAGAKSAVRSLIFSLTTDLKDKLKGNKDNTSIVIAIVTIFMLMLMPFGIFVKGYDEYETCYNYDVKTVKNYDFEKHYPSYKEYYVSSERSNELYNETELFNYVFEVKEDYVLLTNKITKENRKRINK